MAMSIPNIASLTVKEFKGSVDFPTNWMKDNIEAATSLGIDSLIQLPIVAKVNDRQICLSGYRSVKAHLEQGDEVEGYYVGIITDIEDAIQVLEAYVRTTVEGNHQQHVQAIRTELDLYTEEEKEQNQFVQGILAAGNQFILRLNQQNSKFKRVIKEENILNTYIDSQLKEVLGQYQLPIQLQAKTLGEYVKMFFDKAQAHGYPYQPKIGYIRYAFVLYQAFIHVAVSHKQALDTNLLDTYIDNLFTCYINPNKEKWLKACGKNEHVIYALGRRHKQEFIEQYTASKEVFNPFFTTT